MNATPVTNRRAFALGLGALLAGRIVPQTSAKPVSPKSTIPSIKKRVAIQVQNCEDLGGTATTTVRPGGTSVSCSGGGMGGTNCVNSSKRTRCYHERIAPPPDGVGAPIVGGNGGVSGD